ncbi:unnamed protein product [Bursaphelenchus xylophilus]|uniref:(pine wood nematode) hypothetical protein n=1 Tax=Bursaphelenchus xylophilus TaxID=6326 RepID=A0A811LCV7_BURXY|nr:unnamed protein product [Bursaphelenchus xylophilus]CAG9114012.1 unnamed protein product [Bursaphelenchus xylophilus]
MLEPASQRHGLQDSAISSIPYSRLAPQRDTLVDRQVSEDERFARQLAAQLAQEEEEIRNNDYLETNTTNGEDSECGICFDMTATSVSCKGCKQTIGCCKYSRNLKMATACNEWVRIVGENGELKYAQDGFIYSFHNEVRPRPGFDYACLYQCEEPSCFIKIRVDEVGGHDEVQKADMLRRAFHPHPPDYDEVAYQLDYADYNPRHNRNSRGSQSQRPRRRRNNRERSRNYDIPVGTESNINIELADLALRLELTNFNVEDQHAEGYPLSTYQRFLEGLEYQRRQRQHERQIREDEEYARQLSNQWAAENPASSQPSLRNHYSNSRQSSSSSNSSTATGSQISSLPLRVRGPSTLIVERVDRPHQSTAECTICFEKVQNEVKCYECEQIIGCRACVDTWIQSQRTLYQSPSCPLCRGDMNRPTPPTHFIGFISC